MSNLVYGAARSPDLLIRDLGDHFTGAPGSGSDLEGLVGQLRSSLRLGFVELRSSGERKVVVASGDPLGEIIEFPLVLDDRPVGVLGIAGRAGERLDQRTRRSVEQLSDVVALALQLTQVNRDLEVARDRLVEVRHEERRLLRRELHDELGPALAGIGLGLAAVRNGTEPNDPRLDLIDQLHGELAQRTEDVRTMARALLPPALDEGRFEDALGVLVERFSETGLRVTSSAAGADALDPRRQIALYHVAAEAVVNAYRHSGASRCAIEVRHATDDSVTLSVTDDGAGFGSDAGEGVGLHSMRERARELGGTLEVEPGSGGTTVRMRLP